MGSKWNIHTRPGAYSLVFKAYGPKRARTSKCIQETGRKARFLGRTGPNRLQKEHTHSPWGVQPCFQGVQIERARAYAKRGVKPGFLGVRAQRGTNGDLFARPGAYSQVSRAYRPKLTPKETYTHAQGRIARFPGRKNPNGLQKGYTHWTRVIKNRFSRRAVQTC